MNATPKASEFVSLQDAATIAGVSYSTLRSWVHTGKLPLYGQARTYRVLISDLMPRRSPSKRRKPATA